MAARAEARHRRAAAAGYIRNTVASLEAALMQLMAPTLALAVLVHEEPSVPYVASRFSRIASELLGALDERHNGSTQLELLPQGVLQMAWPVEDAPIGLDLLKDPSRRETALETLRRRRATVAGPFTLKEGYLGLALRLPIFIQDVKNASDTFGAAQSAFDCPICYDANTRSRFWGFATAVTPFSNIIRVLTTSTTDIGEEGYQYVLTMPQPSEDPVVIRSAGALDDPTSETVKVPGGGPGTDWKLEIAPSEGWVPAWRDGMLAMVIAVSVLLGLLLLGLLTNRRQLQVLNLRLKAANSALEDEKNRMDALVGRQHRLITLLVQQGKDPSRADARPIPRVRSALSLSKPSADGAGTPHAAHGLIEDVRRSIAERGSSSCDDGDIQLLDLLGEGAFGKVYKGLWRGSVVAVKTMVLPAKMSGAEKRERMAIMEAAISSAMTHPNIVQTYTYFIKPTISCHTQGSQDSAPNTVSSNSLATYEAGKGVTNFEVSLVLEYCGELGSLRDALDHGAFRMAGGSVNYAAVLDVAADVARAMLHCHQQNVLHSDLKARNVLLKPDTSQSGCGVVAKVADFGLALKVDAHDTHVSLYQGTPTHLPPEALLQGRVSKAGDVYSYGVTLYELYTGKRPFASIPSALLGHKVAVEGLRPAFPPDTPQEYRRLAESCWAHRAEDRPSFQEVLQSVSSIRKQLGRPRTAPLTTYTHKRPEEGRGAGGYGQAQACEEQQQQQQQQQDVRREGEERWRREGSEHTAASWGGGTAGPDGLPAGAVIIPVNQREISECSSTVPAAAAAQSASQGAQDGLEKSFGGSFFQRYRRWYR